MIEFHKVKDGDEKTEPLSFKIEERRKKKEEKEPETYTMDSLLEEASKVIKKRPPHPTNDEELRSLWLFHIAVVPIKNIPEIYGPKIILDLFREQGEGTTMESWKFLNLGIYPYNFEDIIDVIKNGGIFIQEDKEGKKPEYKGYPRIVFVRESPETNLIMRVTITPTEEYVYVFTKTQESNFMLDLMHRMILRDKDNKEEN